VKGTDVPRQPKTGPSKVLADNKIYQFYEIEQSKLLLDFRKIALFTKHPGSLGAFREARLRQYLKDLTPNALSVGSGLVSVWNDHSGNIVDDQSRQVDCLVYDEHREVPILSSDDFAIVDPTSLYAGIEVKSSLTFFKQYAKTGDSIEAYPLGLDSERFRWTGTMVDAIKNITSLKRICDLIPGGADGVFFAVFSYGLEFSAGTLYHALDNNELQLQLGITHIDELPGLICVPDRMCILFSGRDMLERAPHHDASTSFMNVIEAVEPHRAYPLQFFSTMYTNQIRSKLSNRRPDVGGLFSMKDAKVKISRWHFDLNSEGYEDQP
jgi:hypothetical protein